MEEGIRGRSIFRPVTVVIVGTVLAALSWLKWPDLLVDFGRELYVPWRLAEGATLYTDLHYWNGPLSPYLNSLMFRGFGTSILAIELLNIFFIALIALLAYRLMGEGSDDASGAFASITFLSIFAFAQFFFVGNFNFVTPYSHELTHGTLVALLAVFSLKLFVKTRAPAHALLLGFVTGLAMLTKIEITLSVTVSIALAFALFLYVWETEKTRKSLAAYLFSAGFLLPTIGAVALLSFKTGVLTAIGSIFGSWIALFATDVGGGQFQRHAMGTDAAWANIRIMLATSVGYVILVASAVVLCRLRAGRGSVTSRTLFLSSLIPTALLLALWNHLPWFELLRPLPLFSLAASGFLFYRILHEERGSREREPLIALFAFSLFSFLMLLKIILNVHVYHYGFALAMPATIILVKAFISWIPPLFAPKAEARDMLRAVFIAALTIFIGWHIWSSNKLYERKALKVGSGGDAIMAFLPHERTPEGAAIKEALKVIDETFSEDDTFVVLPEGITLNYLARRTNPTGYVNFIPSELTIFGEENMLEAFKAAPPDHVILVHKDTSDYGLKYFGRDYGEKIFAWVAKNYRPERLIGNYPLRDEGFGILFLERIGQKEGSAQSSTNSDSAGK